MLWWKAVRFGALGACAALVFAGDVRAQQGEQTVDEEVTVVIDAEAESPTADRKVRRFLWSSEGPMGPSSTWIGVHCTEIPAALRPQLKLEGTAGVVVAEVVADGPAAKAGVATGDIVLSAGDKQIASAADLAAAVNESGDKELTLKIVRAGDALDIVVTPQANERLLLGRPRIGLRAIQPGLVVSGVPHIKMGETDAAGNFTFNVGFARGDAPELPDDVSVSVSRQGKSPPRVTISRGDEAWNVELDKVDELPEDVRGYLAALPSVRPLPGLDHVISFVPKVWEGSVDGDLHRQAIEEHRKAVDDARQRGRELHDRARKTAEVAIEKGKKASAEAAQRAEKAIEQSRIWVEKQRGDMAKTIDVEVHALVKSALDEALAQQAKVEKAAEKIDFEALERRMNDGFDELRKQIEALRDAIDDDAQSADEPSAEKSADVEKSDEAASDE